MSPPNLSLVLVMVCFWLTFWLVQSFLIRPLGKTLRERKERIDGAAKLWSSKHEEYVSATSRFDAEIEEALRDANRQRVELRQAALGAREERLRVARAEIDQRLATTVVQLTSESGAAREELRAHARELSGVLASRVLGREVRP